MGSVIGTELKCLSEKETRGLVRWIKPQSDFCSKEKKIRGLIRGINPNQSFCFEREKYQKSENEKGINVTIRGPPFHFQNFDRASKGSGQ